MRRRKGVLGRRSSWCKGWEERSKAPAGSCLREAGLGERIPDTAKNLKCQTEGLRPSRGQQGAIEGGLNSAAIAFSRVTDPFYR